MLLVLPLLLFWDRRFGWGSIFPHFYLSFLPHSLKTTYCSVGDLSPGVARWGGSWKLSSSLWHFTARAKSGSTETRLFWVDEHRAAGLLRVVPLARLSALPRGLGASGCDISGKKHVRCSEVHPGSARLARIRVKNRNRI